MLNDLISKYSKTSGSSGFEYNFMKLYNESLLTVREDQPYPKDRTRPSSLGKCPRSIYFERTGADRDKSNFNNPWLYNQVGILESGTDRHERIQTVLQRMEEHGHIKNIDIPTAVQEAQQRGINTYFESWNEEKTEARCYNTDLNISFQADGLIEYGGITAVFEIKTCTCKKMADLRKTKEPFKEHIKQATAYALALGVDHILFFYEDRDYTSHLPILHHITQEEKDFVINKLRLVDDAIKEGKIPDKNKDECYFCNFKGLCKTTDEPVSMKVPEVFMPENYSALSDDELF